MLIRIPVDQLPRHQPGHNPGFVEAIRAAAKQAGDFYEIESTTWQALSLQHLPRRNCPGSPESPGLLTKAGRAAQEVTEWIKAGAPLVAPETRTARLAICQACEFYAATGNLGLGECQAPGCGCTRAKLSMATSKCPLTPPKWGPVKAAASSLQPVR